MRVKIFVFLSVVIALILFSCSQSSITTPDVDSSGRVTTTTSVVSPSTISTTTTTEYQYQPREADMIKNPENVTMDRAVIVAGSELYLNSNFLRSIIPPSKFPNLTNGKDLSSDLDFPNDEVIDSALSRIYDKLSEKERLALVEYIDQLNFKIDLVEEVDTSDDADGYIRAILDESKGRDEAFNDFFNALGYDEAALKMDSYSSPNLRQYRKVDKNSRAKSSDEIIVKAYDLAAYFFMSYDIEELKNLNRIFNAGFDMVKIEMLMNGDGMRALSIAPQKSLTPGTCLTCYSPSEAAYRNISRSGCGDCGMGKNRCYFSPCPYPYGRGGTMPKCSYYPDCYCTNSNNYAGSCEPCYYCKNSITPPVVLPPPTTTTTLPSSPPYEYMGREQKTVAGHTFHLFEATSLNGAHMWMIKNGKTGDILSRTINNLFTDLFKDAIFNLYGTYDHSVLFDRSIFMFDGYRKSSRCVLGSYPGSREVGHWDIAASKKNPTSSDRKPDRYDYGSYEPLANFIDTKKFVVNRVGEADGEIAFWTAKNHFLGIDSTKTDTDLWGTDKKSYDASYSIVSEYFCNTNASRNRQEDVNYCSYIAWYGYKKGFGIDIDSKVAGGNAIVPDDLVKSAYNKTQRVTVEVGMPACGIGIFMGFGQVTKYRDEIYYHKKTDIVFRAER